MWPFRQFLLHLLMNLHIPSQSWYFSLQLFVRFEQSLRLPRLILQLSGQLLILQQIQPCSRRLVLILHREHTSLRFLDFDEHLLPQILRQHKPLPLDASYLHSFLPFDPLQIFLELKDLSGPRIHVRQLLGNNFWICLFEFDFFYLFGQELLGVVLNANITMPLLSHHTLLLLHLLSQLVCFPLQLFDTDYVSSQRIIALLLLIIQFLIQFGFYLF